MRTTVLVGKESLGLDPPDELTRSSLSKYFVAISPSIYGHQTNHDSLLGVTYLRLKLTSASNTPAVVFFHQNDEMQKIDVFELSSATSWASQVTDMVFYPSCSTQYLELCHGTDMT